MTAPPEPPARSVPTCQHVSPPRSLQDCARIVATGTSPDGNATVEHWAWVNRHERWPVTYAEVRARLTHPAAHPAAEVDRELVGVAAETVLAGVLLCARRLQYGFAWRLLDAFTRAALADYPDEPDLHLHRATSAVMVTGTPSDWEHLAENATADPARYGTDFLTVAVTAPTVTADMLNAALAVAHKQTADGIHVGAYRVVSLQRRLGRIPEAWEALAVAEEMLVIDPPYHSLFEHLAERLFTERVLLSHIADPSNRPCDPSI